MVANRDGQRNGQGQKAKRPSHIHQFMITQQLDARYWPLLEGHEDDVLWILERIVSVLEGEGHTVGIAYAIKHDRDVHHLLDTLTPDPLFYSATPGTPKRVHGHFLLHFAKGDKGMTVKELSECLGIRSQYIQRTKPGKYGWDNLCAYLIHRKQGWKYQYDPTDVVNARGPSYTELEKKHRLLWYNGRQYVDKTNAGQFVPYLEELARTGQISSEDLLRNDELFEVYSRLGQMERGAITSKIEMATQRRLLLRADKMQNLDTRKGVVFIHGSDSGSGKTLAGKTIAESLKRKYGWKCFKATPKHSLEGYVGQEVILLDEFAAAGWGFEDFLQLIDPSNYGEGDGRFSKIGQIAPNLIIITSSADLPDLVWSMKGSSDHSRPLDEVLRRLSFYVEATGYVLDDQLAEYRRHGFDVYRVVILKKGKTRTWPLPDNLTAHARNQAKPLESLRDFLYEGSVESQEDLADMLLESRILAASLPGDLALPARPQDPLVASDLDQVVRSRAVAHLTPIYAETGARHLVDEHQQTNPRKPYGWVPGCEECNRLATALGHSPEEVSHSDTVGDFATVESDSQ